MGYSGRRTKANTHRSVKAGPQTENNERLIYLQEVRALCWVIFKGLTLTLGKALY